MREDIQGYYKKVVNNLEDGNLEASAIAVRHILEIIINEYTDKYIPEQTYADTFKKINALLEGEFISKETASILHELRQIGNKGAHASEGNPLTSEELRRCIAPLEMVIDEFDVKIEEVGIFARVNKRSQKEEEFEKYLKLAYNAFHNGDFKQAEQYFKKCLSIDQMSWEGTFYSTYCRCCKEKDLQKASQQQVGCLSSVFYMLKEKYKGEPVAAELFALRIIEMSIEFQKMVDTEAQNIYYNMPVNARAQYIVSYGIIRATTAYSLYNLGNLVEKEFSRSEEVFKLAIKAWKTGINIHSDALKSQEKKGPHKEDISIMENKVKRYEPYYVAPTPSACYVATAVYNSYDCPEVWTLRRFRDDCLDETWYGKLFIKVYYFVSPKLLKVFGNNKKFKAFVRKKLDKFVTELQAKGYSNTPYKDKSYKSN